MVSFAHGLGFVVFLNIGLFSTMAVAVAGQACGGTPGEINSDSFGSFRGVVTQIEISGHGANSAETAFWLVNGKKSKQFGLWADTDARVYSSLVEAMEISRVHRDMVEVCFCEMSSTALAKAVAINAGYPAKLCNSADFLKGKRK